MSLAQLSAELLTTQSKELKRPNPKVIQFGTGALLRGLNDWVIQQANDQDIFNGGIIAVGSTGSGRTLSMNAQNGLFTHRIEGFTGGESVQKFQLNSSILQAYSARDAWSEILKLVQEPGIEVILSNTTEVGLQYQEEDVSAMPPQSYPAKLTALLHERFKHHPAQGFIILPTELVVDNGKVLQGLVLQQIDANGLGEEFKTWVLNENHFCSTLVDRIVTGSPSPEGYLEMSQELGYEDKMLTVSEVYRLWAIEGPPHLASRISFVNADPGVILADDITPYRERKLRILNGSHTISVALGYLYGLDNIVNCMRDEHMSAFMCRVMEEEIVPSLPESVSGGEEFAKEVQDRFRNPYLDHKLLSITFQYTSKMKMRNGATFQRYVEKTGHAPKLMCLGFAAYMRFLKPVREENGKYFGEWQGQSYPLHDDQASWWHMQWQSYNPTHQEAWIRHILSQKEKWGSDLNYLADFPDLVIKYAKSFDEKGVAATLQEALQA